MVRLALASGADDKDHNGIDVESPTVGDSTDDGGSGATWGGPFPVRGLLARERCDIPRAYRADARDDNGIDVEFPTVGNSADDGRFGKTEGG
jgi:hypothetical protein